MLLRCTNFPGALSDVHRCELAVEDPAPVVPVIAIVQVLRPFV